MEQEDLRRRQIQAHDEPIRKGSPVQEGDGSDGGEGTGHSGPDLPEMRFGYVQLFSRACAHRTSGVIYIPCCQREMLPKLLVYLMPFYVHGDTVVESDAPNLSNFRFSGHRPVQLSLGVALQLKKLSMSYHGVVCYARASLPSILPNVESLSLCSPSEMVNTPMLPSRFLHLKYLSVGLVARTFSPAYDYCSLISFFDASPSLETFILNVFQMKMEHESIVGDPSHLRQMPAHRHDNLKTVKIMGFSAAKSLVELTCHIVENTTSLEYLTLDTTRGHPFASCSSNKSGKCLSMCRDVLAEAREGLLAIRTYVEPKVPSSVKLTVVEPCRRCHGPDL